MTDKQREIHMIVVRVQAGEREQLTELWRRVRWFVEKKADKLITRLNGRCSVTKEDLIQSGYIAMLEAVSTYDGTSGFLSWLEFYLKHTFAQECGFKTSKRDLFTVCGSMDEPLPTTEDEDLTLHDVVPDPHSADGYEAVENEMYTTQLRRVLEDALAEIPEDDAAAIRLFFFEGRSAEEAAGQLGVTAAEFSKTKTRALREIRCGRLVSTLREFSPYSGTGLHAWQSSGRSIEERYVIMKDAIERNYRREMPAE